MKISVSKHSFAEPGAPVRVRNLNANWDNTHFKTPRAIISNDKFKPKHTPDNWARSQHVKIANTEPKPSQPTKVVPKMNVPNKDINHHGHKMGVKQDFIHPTQKPLVGIKKVNAQKNLATHAASIVQKTRMSAPFANVDETLTLKMTRNPKILNKTIQKNKLPEVNAAQKIKVPGVTAAQKPKVLGATVAQTSKIQEVGAAQKPKVQGATVAQIPKTQEVAATQKLKAQDATTAQISKTQEVGAAQKPKAQGATVAQIPKTQEVTAAQKTKIKNDIAFPKNKAQQEVDSTTIKTQNNSPKLSNSHENATAKTKAAEELAKKTKPVTEECKAQSKEQATEKHGSEQPKKEAPSEEKRELSELLARAVEQELQDVMIQVWQELPDDPTEEADRVVVEKLRNEVGDDLQRVLGLNITKRLLNVYNNLFLKIKLTCRPQMGCLTSFLKEYKIGKFKRIDKNSNTFAAEMDNVEDFDRLCAVKELMCGDAKVTVIPCYKYTQCPEKLKTIYDDTYFFEDSVQVHTMSPNTKEAQKAKVIASNENITKPEKEPKYAENTSDLDKAQPSANKTTETTTNIQKGKTVNTNENIIKPDKETENKDNNKDLDKIIIKNTEKLVSNISEDIKKDTTNDEKTIDLTQKTTKESNLKETIVTDNILMKKKVSIELGKDKDICEYVIKDILGSGDEADDEFAAGVPECEMDGDDELDDEDILALMSEGVVLDECTGSEDEK